MAKLGVSRDGGRVFRGSRQHVFGLILELCPRVTQVLPRALALHHSALFIKQQQWNLLFIFFPHCVLGSR